MLRVVPLLAVVALGVSGCALGGQRAPGALTVKLVPPAATLTLPRQSTCDGPGTQPWLAWGKPDGQTLAVLVELLDLDAPKGQQVLWMVYGDGSDPGRGSLSVALPPVWHAGTNDRGTAGYAAPCPAKGSTGHYRLLVRAYDQPFEPGAGGPALAAGFTAAALESALASHHVGLVDTGQLDLTYRRS